MIIGTCGFGATGSSVVTDYLKEYEDIIVKDDIEFAYVYETDGLACLERDIMHPLGRTLGSISSIKRFEEMVEKRKKTYERCGGLPSDVFVASARKFVDSITMTKWYWSTGKKSEWRYNPKHILRRYMEKKVIPSREKKTGHRVNLWPLEEVKLSVRPDNFYEAAKLHIDEMLTAMGLDTNAIIALDQPFSGNNPQASFPFFNDPYAVVVDRDPRDLYVFGKTKLMGRKRFFPIETVEDFIIYYKCLRKDQPYLQPHPRVLNLCFEDLVYEYDKTTVKLRDFLHLPENPHPKSVFDPSLSVANTQVFKRFTQFADDVKKIEDALPEYLFDYSKYPTPDFSKKMFFGKSPLHDGYKKSFEKDGYVPQSKQ